jgi:hypothetical protein
MKFNKTKLFAIVALALSASFTACKKDDGDGDIDTPKEVEVLEGQITTKKVLDANKIYLLRGYVRVMGNGGNLEIPAGTVIKGEKATMGALIIERGGYIKANGTASNPIIFTSDQDASVRKEGDWAGVVICGRSKVNTADGTAQYEGGALGADIATYGGGANPVLADNSGEFTYVRIEFAGYPIQTDKEINGLTLCGVGSATKVNHIQVSYSLDDSFEFFGGTVNASHLIAYRGLDDDFDFDQGFSGSIQYGISFRDPNMADKSISRAIELENKGTVSRDEHTRPVLSNFTFVGPGTAGVANHGASIHFGLNSRMVLANSIIVGAKGNAVEFNSDFPAAELKAGRSVFSNNLVFGNAANYGLLSVTSFPSVADFTTFAAAAGNTTIASVDAAGFNNTNIATPDLTLKTGSPALGKAKWEGDLASAFFTKETFVGAMGSANWTSGWASWTPKTNTY